MRQTDNAAVTAVDVALPPKRLTNGDLAKEFPDWSAEKIFEKTGIRERTIAEPDLCASDLAFEAARRLFAQGVCDASNVDLLLFCTQSPDYFLPTTACLLQERLGLSTECAAFDFNLGCSGWVYGLAIAKGMIETGQAGCALLLTADTYTHYIHPSDRANKTIFSDGAAATLIESVQSDEAPSIGGMVLRTDGRGAMNLCVKAGASRHSIGSTSESPDGPGDRNLFMNGPEIFAFTLNTVPQLVEDVLVRAGLALADLDWVVMHQANRFILDALRKKIRIPAEKFVVNLEYTGNTVSSTIPIVLADLSRSGRLLPNMKVLVAGFGVGYSWGGCVLRWPSSDRKG